MKNKKIFSLVMAVALVGALGVTAAAAANGFITLTAVEGVTPNFEDAIPGELTVMGEIDSSLYEGQGVTAAKDSVSLVPVEGVTPDFENVIPGELIVLGPVEIDSEMIGATTAAK